MPGKATSSKNNAVNVIPFNVLLKPEGSTSQKKRTAGFVATTNVPATIPKTDGKLYICCAANIVIYELSNIPLLDSA